MFDTVDRSMDSGTLDIMASAKRVRSGRRSATPRTRRVGSSKQLAIRQTCSRFLLDGTTVVADHVPSEMPRQLLINTGLSRKRLGHVWLDQAMFVPAR